jgi:hypothetical protein
MSLIGSLEDLSLGDILQIISLSQKSGVLSIRGEDGEGTIVLRDGLVRGGCVKGGPVDLRGVIVGGRFLEPEQFDEACERARREGISVDEALAASTVLTTERIDSLRRECVEAAVMAMFAWRTGEFSFDVRTGVEAEAPPLFLPTGINAQYLAMEGSRIEDESAHIRSEWQEERDAESAGDGPELLAEPYQIDPADALARGPGFGDTSNSAGHDPEEDTFVDDLPSVGPVEALGIAVAERCDADFVAVESLFDDLAPSEPILSDEVGPGVSSTVDADETLELATEVEFAIAGAGPGAAKAELEPEPNKSAEPVVSQAPGPLEAASRPAPAASSPSKPLVVIDPDLVALEWIKQTLADAYPRIHIFQRWDLGLGPIRQYLARANCPVVLVRPDAAGDPLSGIRNTHDFVSRLKSQQPRMTVLWLQDAEPTVPLDLGSANGVLMRPSSRQLRSQRGTAQLEELAAGFGEDLSTLLAQHVEPEPAASGLPSAEAGPASSDALSRLKEATAALGEASSRGEVLPLAIRFAGEVFDRVAMFMVRDQSVAGIAQHGLERAGGPDDSGLRQVELSAHGCAWFRTVLETRRPIRQGPSDSGDYTLAALLGSSAANEAYVAPIESSGEIAALLYADNLATRRPLGDTPALDVVLQHAGLALERTVLERALAKAESNTD